MIDCGYGGSRVYTYHKGCRCDVCRAAYSEYKGSWRRTSPAAEHERAYSAAYKERHREHCRAYDRAYSMGGECGECGGPISRRSDGGVCLPCRRREVRTRREMVCAMWADGLSMREICSLLGWTQNHLCVEMAQMRSAGWDLPHRYRVGAPQC